MQKDIAVLNDIYHKVNQRKQELIKYIEEVGYTFKCNYYAHHWIRVNRKWVEEEYPIPVITIDGFGDLGVDIDHIFLELILSKKKALVLDYRQFEPLEFEVYGAESFLEDFYQAEMNLEEIKSRIQESHDAQIGISFFFTDLTSMKVIFAEITQIETLIHSIYDLMN